MRNRLIVAVAVVAAAIAGAGAPAVIAASGQLQDSQRLVTDAERTQQALTLAHSLADERDEVISYIAGGRPKGKGLSEQRSARVDRQADELRTDAPAALLRDIKDIAAVRRAALTGTSTALEAHVAYSEVIAELHALAEDLADQLPPRAGAGSHALVYLDNAVEQAAAARGLLLAAYAVPRTATTTTTIDPATGLPTTVTREPAAATKARGELSAAAQQARVREQAALADFQDSAPAADRTSYDSTVTGPDVTAAEKYLARLTDQPKLSAGDLRYSSRKLDAAISARIDLMRGVEASLNAQRTKDLAQLRDDDVTALEIRIALVGVCLLVAVGVSMAMARTLTRPLAVLRIGSARVAGDPAAEQPIRFTGRNDEFAQVVRSVNALHTHAVGLHERLATFEADRKHLVGQRATMADEREALRAQLADAKAGLERMRHSVHSTFVNLSLRTLGLVERQLGIIERLEEREQDPERLSTLFKLDHLATVMRRHSENLLVLAGAEHGHHNMGPVPLVDVVRAAVSEIERYERVRISSLPPHAHVAGFAADDLSHLIAELLENATSFSPPDASVEVSGWLLENGEVMLSVQDEGIGMTGERLQEVNARLSTFDPDGGHDQESEDELGLGLYVVARLAARHGLRVQLREQKHGGITAVVVLPKPLLAAAPGISTPAAAPVVGGAPSVALPGSEAEANSNVLLGRAGRDPLISAAEQSLREAGETAERGRGEGDDADAYGRAAGADDAYERAVDDPDTHERAADEGEEPGDGGQPPADQPGAAHVSPEDGPRAGLQPPTWDRVTDKGLPKRTPRVAQAPSVPKPRTGSVDAEALRRRLGGFQQGSRAGRRDVEAEIAGEGAQSPKARGRSPEAPTGTAESPERTVWQPEPMAESPAPTAESRERTSDAPAWTADSRERLTELREQTAWSSESAAELPEPMAEPRERAVWQPEPAAESLERAARSPERAAWSPGPTAEAPQAAHPAPEVAQPGSIARTDEAKGETVEEASS
ncbi:nitrate- and nitrite sensing domain-containing protein [Streptomyces sp. PSKA28]|uniref:histidine kinase n=1 Tax=Streptomyces himalayensis subsp. himalayensis TaxID=2756131 RepID=A0A7W0DG68_9ACTN|nr:nitrate- and nitrite sensing domain-containing protein [Streptomyces himalayensis subsp. himalayensis]